MYVGARICAYVYSVNRVQKGGSASLELEWQVAPDMGPTLLLTFWSPEPG